jgi:hypothetical protein
MGYLILAQGKQIKYRSSEIIIWKGFCNAIAIAIICIFAENQ